MKDIIYVYDKAGNKKPMEVVFTFQLDGFNKNYMIYKEVNSTSDEYFVAGFNPNKDYTELDTNLLDIEKKYIQEVFNRVMKENNGGEA